MTYGEIENIRDLILRIYWDGRTNPSVEVALGNFFASAKVEANSETNKGEYRQINSMAVCLNSKSGMNCYWEMPFRQGFRMTIENRASRNAILYYQIACEEKVVTEDALYFHAQFRRTNPLPYMQDYTILDNVRGRGQYVGIYLYWGGITTTGGEKARSNFFSMETPIIPASAAPERKSISAVLIILILEITIRSIPHCTPVSLRWSTPMGFAVQIVGSICIVGILQIPFTFMKISG